MEGREREGPKVTVEPGPLGALLRHCNLCVEDEMKISKRSVVGCINAYIHERYSFRRRHQCGRRHKLTQRSQDAETTVSVIILL